MTVREEPATTFAHRHIGPSPRDIDAMLGTVGAKSLATLIDEALPPAILLGGGANALSVARSLGRLGVAVYALEDPGTFVRYSRHCRRLPRQ